MSQDQLNPIAPEGEENSKEIQQLPVEDKENTPEMAMQLGLPPPEPLDLRWDWRIIWPFLGSVLEC